MTAADDPRRQQLGQALAAAIERYYPGLAEQVNPWLLADSVLERQPLPELDTMQVAVTLHTVENYGDHAGEVTKAQTYDPYELVGAMVRRIMRLPAPRYTQFNPTDAIRLQVVEGTEPKEADDGTPPF
jgi:hypothetical protein